MKFGSECFYCGTSKSPLDRQCPKCGATKEKHSELVQRASVIQGPSGEGQASAQDDSQIGYPQAFVVGLAVLAITFGNLIPFLLSLGK